MSIKQFVLRTFVLGAVAASATLVAKADTLDFTLTGQGTDITWTLSSTPAVSSYSTPNGEFTLDGIKLDANGHHITTDLSFFTSAEDGGLAAAQGSNFLFNLIGSQLFTGGVSDPTFKTGNFTLTPYGSSEGYSYCDTDGQKYHLSIVDPTAVTPEPSSMILLATGLLTLVGAGAAKRFAA